jgi:hypothetical protein
MITAAQIEASRARALKMDDARDRAISKAEAAWDKYDQLLLEYYKQCKAKATEAKEGAK